MLLLGKQREEAELVLSHNHYSHSVPSGKSLYFAFEDAIVVYSIPANNNLSKFLVGEPNAVWELSRLWAPDGHRENLLTQAIAVTLSEFRREEPTCKAVVSYADPNAGHSGGVYKAASWVFTGQSEESRLYKDTQGNLVSRRAFHSGKTGMKKADILAKGYIQLRAPGKLRFVKALSARYRKIISKRFPTRP